MRADRDCASVVPVSCWSCGWGPTPGLGDSAKRARLLGVVGSPTLPRSCGRSLLARSGDDGTEGPKVDVVERKGCMCGCAALRPRRTSMKSSRLWTSQDEVLLSMAIYYLPPSAHCINTLYIYE